MPTSTPSAASNPQLLAAWERHRELCRLRRDTARQHRQAAADLRALRRDLARQLAEQHAALAFPGCESGFHRWLRLHHIPRSTAYRLIALHNAPPSPPKGGNCPTSARETTQNAIELRGQTLTLHLTPFQACMFRHYWAAQTAPGARPFDFIRSVCDLIEGGLPLALKNVAHEFALAHIGRFTPEICASITPLCVRHGELGTVPAHPLGGP